MRGSMRSRRFAPSIRSAATGAVLLSVVSASRVTLGTVSLLAAPLLSLSARTGLAAPMQVQDGVPVVPQLPVAVYDIVCTYKKETFTLHCVTVFDAAAKAAQPNWPNRTSLHMSSPNDLNYLFPTGTCGDLSACFDPYDRRPPADKDVPRLQTLPSETLDGVPCRVLQMTDPPLPPRAGFQTPLPAFQHIALRWYIAPDGQVKRMHGALQLWKADGKTPDPDLLVMEADYKYRDPIGSAARPLSAPPLRTLTVPSEKKDAVRDIACSPAKPLLITASRMGNLRVWDAESLKPIYTLQGEAGYGRSMVFSADGSRLADGIQGADGTAHLWDMRTGQKSRDITTGSRMLTSMALSPDGRLLVTLGIGLNTAEPVRVWDTESGQRIASINAPGAGQIAFSPDGKTLVTDGLHSLHLWDTASWKERLQLQPDIGLEGTSGTAPLAFSPDGRLLAVGDTRISGLGIGVLPDTVDEDLTASVVWVWDTQTGKLVQTLRGTTGPVYSLAFAPNGKTLAVVDRDCGAEGPGRNSAVLLWDTQTWKQAGIAGSEHGKSIVNAAWTADSSTLLTSYEDALVKFWAVPRR